MESLTGASLKDVSVVKNFILKAFSTGQSPNHIVFLLHYKYNIDFVNKTIRDEFNEMERELEYLDNISSW